MQKEIKRSFDWVYALCCWLLAVSFIYAGGTKLLDPNTFAVLIEAYGLIPEALLMPVAIALPAMEVVAGIGLLLNIRGSLAAIAALLLLFVAILAYGIWMGLDVDCGCFGPQDPEADAFHGLRTSLYRDLAMLAGIAFIYAWRQYRDLQTVPIMSTVKKNMNKEKRKW